MKAVVFALAICFFALAITSCDGGGPVDPPPDPVDSVKITLQIEIFLASGNKPELPVEGAKICRFLDGTRDLCQNISGDGKTSFSGPFLNESYFPFVIESPTTIPFFLNLKKENYSKTIKAILIEKNWTLTKGFYAGTSVPISLELAYKPTSPGSPPSFFYITDNQTTGGKKYIFRTFKENSFPLPVVLDRTSSDYQFTSTDSINIWIHIRNLENFFGRNLFYPKEQTSQQNRQNSVIITVKNSLSAGATGGGYSSGNTYILTGGEITYSGPAISSGSLTFTNEGTIYHEFGHVLGFGHTCSWKTKMYTGCDNSQNSPIWTPEDVAYKEVFYTVQEIRRKYPGSYGIAESHQGERVVLLGLQPQLYQVFP